MSDTKYRYFRSKEERGMQIDCLTLAGSVLIINKMRCPAFYVMYDGSECSLLSTRLTDYPSLFPLHPASTVFYDLEIQD